VTSYHLGRPYRIFVFFGAAFFGFGVVATIIRLVTVAQPMPDRAFLTVWIAVVVFGQYWYLFRQAYDLRFDNEYLYWRSPLRAGKVLVHDLRRVRVRWGTDAIIESVDGRRLHVLAQKGFGRFCAKLAAQHPSLVVRIGWMHRLIEWLPGSTPFRG
jgi:hypothetical protein